jgi:3-phosphoshikimate 1-carboxyvinyltransferase
MRAIISPRPFSGELRIPGSKSHTIRRLILAALGDGVSDILYPLDSLDARSCLNIVSALGAEAAERRGEDPACPNPPDGDGKKLLAWTVRGLGIGAGGSFRKAAAPLDVGNSGTTLFLALAAAALGTEPLRFTGDEQIGRRSGGPLLDALAGLGAAVESNQGCAPITVQGPWKGGRVRIECPTSQYLSALLLAAPLAAPGVLSEIDVPLLYEKPYVNMTLSYLKALGAPFQCGDDLSWFTIPGGARYRPLSGPAPGDFSSAAFPGGVAALTGGPVTLLGLDPEDSQGDKAFFPMLQSMGCSVEWSRRGDAWALRVFRSGPLRGGEFDLNDTPDLLPMMAVIGAFAQGDTVLMNAASARIKETDRIAVMAEELGRLGALTRELPDGLVIHGSGRGLAGGRTDSRGDHRIAMALAAGALAAAAPVEIEAAESAAVTYPAFLEWIGADRAE